MGDQTKSIQTLSIEGSIEHKKHNQLDIKYLHHLFIRNPRLGVWLPTRAQDRTSSIKP